METGNEFSLRHTEFEGHPIKSKLLAVGNSGLGLRREIRAIHTNLGIISARKGYVETGIS